MMNIIKNIIAMSFAVFLFPAYTMAQADGLPEMLVSKTVMSDTVNNINSYSGMTGNYAVFNPGVATNLGFDDRRDPNGNALPDTQSIFRCRDGIIAIGACFVLVSGLPGSYSTYTNNPVSLMVSRVQANTGLATYSLLELPVLFYSSRTVVGDAVMPNYDNFALWGKNLAQKKTAGSIDSAVGASWALGGYEINAKSQSAWGTDTEGEYAKFNEKIQTLAKSGTIILSSELNPVTGNSVNLYLQTLNADINTSEGTTGPSGTQIAKYPEGRVWVVNGNVSIPAGKTITYYGIGTLIIRGGNLVVGDGAKIKPNNEKDDKLGIIVLEN